MQWAQNRRRVLRRAGASMVLASSLLAGCSSNGPGHTPSEFSPTEVAEGAGQLPVHQSKTRTDKERDNLEENETDVMSLEADVSDDRIELDTYGGILSRNKGEFGMSAGANFGTFWKAPTDGEYTVTAEYGGKGSYLGPGEDPGWDFVAAGGLGLAVSERPGKKIAGSTVRHLNSANEGIRTQVAEKLLETIALRLVSPYFGVVGTLIARALIGWAIDLEPPNPNRGQFLIKPWEPQQIETSFMAEKDEIYKIDFAPVIGFNVKSHVIQWGNPYVSVKSWYEVESISIT